VWQFPRLRTMRSIPEIRYLRLSPQSLAAPQVTGTEDSDMNVSTILKEKGNAVVTAAPSSSVLDIVKTLADKRIGAIVLLNGEGRVAGIVSERDIIRHLARSGPAILSASVADVMTRGVITCTPADTIDVLMQKMTTGRFRHLPVVEHDRLVGLISIGDVVKNRVAEVELEANAMKQYLST